MSALATLPMRSLLDITQKARQSKGRAHVWCLNLDQIESHSGKVLSKLKMVASGVGSSTYGFEAGTVLYSKLRPYLNKVVVADADGIATTELVPLRCDESKAMPYYLAHFLRSPVFLAFATNVVAGAKVHRMVMGDFWNYPVPLPPLNDQRRITAILDQAETLRTQRRQALAHLDTLTQSLFHGMFGDSVANDRGWPNVLRLGEVADIASGVTKGRNLEGKATRKLPYLAVVNVQDKSLRLDEIKSIDATDDEIQRYRLQKNDLLLTEGGDPDKLGRGTLWNDELPECIHQNHIFRVRLTTELLTPLFLNWIVGSPRGKKYFLRSAKQTTGIASINMTQLKGFPLLVPPLPLQQTFATRIHAIEALKATHRTALAQLDALFASLQQRAFAGEL